MNPFLNVTGYAVYNPGTLEMALPVVEAVGIRAGMRVLELGGGRSLTLGMVVGRKPE